MVSPFGMANHSPALKETGGGNSFPPTVCTRQGEMHSPLVVQSKGGKVSNFQCVKAKTF